jgi:Ni/Co efflux regulator RcnB
MDTRKSRLVASLLAASLLSTTAFAGPPPWAGGGRHDDEREHGRREVREEHHGDRVVVRERVVVRQGHYFDAHHRESVQRYYVSHCPPGLAKKHNGCMPPGHAKRVWVVGQPLPATVVLAPPPPQLVVSLPPPPAGHRYVEVAGDVLLIAVGTKMVVDGISGLSR